MFEIAELGRKLSKAEYEEAITDLRTELLAVQRDLKDASFPVLILLNGVEGAGKGESLNLLHEWMDARYLHAHAFGPPTEHETQYPAYRRYWMALPRRGHIGLYVGNWYTQPIVKRVYEKHNDAEFDRELNGINAFEKALVDDGALVLKFWFHLSESAQKKRLKKLRADPETAWRVTKKDQKYFKRYDDFRRFSERAIRRTSTGEAPWLVIEGADARYRSVTMARHILERVRVHTRARSARPSDEAIVAPAENPVTILDQLDLTKSLPRKTYSSKLEHWQGQLAKLAREAYRQRLGGVFAFEGWDAAGKGGAIRRMIVALDARQYRVIPIAAPTDEERAHHYLWRFWRALPPRGRLTIYDRSWYGRVLVERVEQLATEPQWRRAYKEINDFEQQLVESGLVLAKFWLHLSADEQLRRFKEREQTPWKKHKITDEDYRNRDKMHLYEVAADEMVGRTSTEYAPWTLIEAEDKPYARIKVIKTVCERLDAALQR